MSSVAAVLAEGAQLLRASSDAPRADALLLLERTLRRPRAWMYAYGDAPLSAPQAAAFRRRCRRRREGVPTAYIVGEAWFYGRAYAVDRRVLVPRPETEHLVDEAIAFVGGRRCRVLDVGTGCGAIACSVAASTPAELWGTDASAPALALARRNARRLAVVGRCTFLPGHLTHPVQGLRFDCAIANLPYVPTSDIPAPPNPVSFEPRLALDGGPDGLALYRELLELLAPLLAERALALFEAAPPTIRRLEALVRGALGGFEVRVERDYAGLERYVTARREAPRGRGRR